MARLLISAGCFLTAILWVIWMRTRFARSLARLERMYARQSLMASLAPVAEPRDAEITPEIDDRQMNLFDNVPPAIVQMPSAARTSQPLRRRTNQPATERPAAERLDWQYFNKDHGDLAYPAAKDRRRTVPPVVEFPRRRA